MDGVLKLIARWRGWRVRRAARVLAHARAQAREVLYRASPPVGVAMRPECIAEIRAEKMFVEMTNAQGMLVLLLDDGGDRWRIHGMVDGFLPPGAQAALGEAALDEAALLFASARAQEGLDDAN